MSTNRGRRWCARRESAARVVVWALGVSLAVVVAHPAMAQAPPPFKPPPTNLHVVLPKIPHVTSFHVISGPFLRFSDDRGTDTTIEAELADFDPAAEPAYRPALWSTGCGTTTGQFPKSEPGGTPYKVRWSFPFIGVENSGKTCTMQVQAYSTSAKLAAGTLTLPSLQTYTVTSTADLLNLTTSSGVHLSASANKGGVIPCELGSVGTAGAFSTGVVVDAGRLTFQLRNGLFEEDCQFNTSAALVVKPEWSVKAVTWQFVTDSHCSDGNARFGVQPSSGQFVTFYSDETAIFRVRFEVACRPDSADATRNNHLYKATLASFQLVGPPGARWQDAFK
jgi:hypothetical protein